MSEDSESGKALEGLGRLVYCTSTLSLEYLLCCACATLYPQPGAGRQAGIRKEREVDLDLERPRKVRQNKIGRGGWHGDQAAAGGGGAVLLARLIITSIYNSIQHRLTGHCGGR